jgi:hypothetical protein
MGALRDIIINLVANAIWLCGGILLTHLKKCSVLCIANGL